MKVLALGKQIANWFLLKSSIIGQVGASGVSLIYVKSSLTSANSSQHGTRGSLHFRTLTSPIHRKVLPYQVRRGGEVLYCTKGSAPAKHRSTPCHQSGWGVVISD